MKSTQNLTFGLLFAVTFLGACGSEGSSADDMNDGMTPGMGGQGSVNPGQGGSAPMGNAGSAGVGTGGAPGTGGSIVTGSGGTPVSPGTGGVAPTGALSVRLANETPVSQMVVPSKQLGEATIFAQYIVSNDGDSQQEIKSVQVEGQMRNLYSVSLFICSATNTQTGTTVQVNVAGLNPTTPDTSVHFADGPVNLDFVANAPSYQPTIIPAHSETRICLRGALSTIRSSVEDAKTATPDPRSGDQVALKIVELKSFTGVVATIAPHTPSAMTLRKAIPKLLWGRAEGPLRTGAMPNTLASLNVTAVPRINGTDPVGLTRIAFTIKSSVPGMLPDAASGITLSITQGKTVHTPLSVTWEGDATKTTYTLKASLKDISTVDANNDKGAGPILVEVNAQMQGYQVGTTVKTVLDAANLWWTDFSEGTSHQQLTADPNAVGTMLLPDYANGQMVAGVNQTVTLTAM